MEISVTNRQRKTGISTRHVRLLACRVLVNESACFDEVSVNFLGEAAVRELNLRFTGRDEVTDTLAFEMAPDGLPRARRGSARGDAGPGAMGARLGDVVVCVDRAAEQAEHYGVGLDEELARLTIHGLLHLCGLDDATPAQRLRMKRREDFYLRRLEELVRCLVPAPAGARVPRGRRAGRSAGARGRPGPSRPSSKKGRT
jgi:probable rRNA maturation factor